MLPEIDAGTEAVVRVRVEVDPGRLLLSLDVAAYVLRACARKMWNHRNYPSAIAARSTAETLERFRRDCSGLMPVEAVPSH